MIEQARRVCCPSIKEPTIHVNWRIPACNIDIDDCQGVTCQVINTHCVDGVDSYSCQCQPGFYGI